MKLSCPNCPTTKPPFTTQRSLKRHQESVHSSISKVCSECEKSFSSKEQLQRHMKDSHPESPFQCHLCGQILLSACALKTHSKRHEGKVCSVCCKSFSTVEELVEHKKEHAAKGKAFTCSYCDKTFTRTHDVKRHISSAHQDGTFCILCKKYVTGSVEAHLASKHREVKKFLPKRFTRSKKI